uniref:Capa n=1 Tax=Carabus violaceus TaxID=41075 RepID=A0A7U3RBR7_CARVO|nr:capa [Carabus violaceus]
MEFLVKSATAPMLLFLVIAMCYAEGEYQTNTYNRRAGTNMGLFPFPRIGRSDPSLASLYADLHEVKRQGLMPFPRVGRSEMRTHFGTQALAVPAWMVPENLVEFQKRNTGNVNGGMWFGPRLGRLQKRSFEYTDAPWALVALKEPSAGTKQADYAPRTGRESEEDSDDSVVEEVLSSRRLDAKSRNNNVAQ